MNNEKEKEDGFSYSWEEFNEWCKENGVSNQPEKRVKYWECWKAAWSVGEAEGCSFAGAELSGLMV